MKVCVYTSSKRPGYWGISEEGHEWRFLEGSSGIEKHTRGDGSVILKFFGPKVPGHYGTSQAWRAQKVLESFGVEYIPPFTASGEASWAFAIAEDQVAEIL